MKQYNTVEHYIEGPRKPVLQEKQVFLVLLKNGQAKNVRYLCWGTSRFWFGTVAHELKQRLFSPEGCKLFLEKVSF